ncbi:PepSY domain-containing protein [Mycobacterium sp. AMU20-3851]|uniref:PepSY domain-containing protein n=1 Tax=Mycobacterium sp. AMU20-3851 TaxID=3122055 RepID=UPI0037545DB9
MTKHAASVIPLSALAVAGIVVLSACSSGDGDATSQSSATSAASSEVASTTQTSATQAPDAALGPDADLATATFPVDLDRALSVAGDAAPGGTITKIELEFDRSTNAWVWKIDSQNATEQREIKIDAQSARVLADERDQESSNPVAVDPRRLPPMDALGLATALVPGSVESWALEFDDGRQRYSVDIRTPGGVDNDADVDVDVETRAATRS